VAVVEPWSSAAARPPARSLPAPTRTPSAWSEVVGTLTADIPAGVHATQSVKVPPTSTATEVSRVIAARS